MVTWWMFVSHVANNILVGMESDHQLTLNELHHEEVGETIEDLNGRTIILQGIICHRAGDHQLGVFNEEFGLLTELFLKLVYIFE